MAFIYKWNPVTIDNFGDPASVDHYLITAMGVDYDELPKHPITGDLLEIGYVGNADGTPNVQGLIYWPGRYDAVQVPEVGRYYQMTATAGGYSGTDIAALANQVTGADVMRVWVQAVRADGAEGIYSTPFDFDLTGFTPDPVDLPPSTPTGLLVTPGDEQATLAWTANSDGRTTGYNVYRGGTKITPTPLAVPVLVDTGLTNGSAYSYRVSATGPGGESPQGAAVQVTLDRILPAAPTGLAATPGNGQITLNWDDNAEAELLGYNVYRGGVQVNFTTIETSTYTVTGLTNGVPVTFTVRAILADGEGPASLPVTETPSPPLTKTGRRLVLISVTRN